MAPGKVRWGRRLADAPQGGWGLVVRAPSSWALGRELAARHGGGAYVFDQISPAQRRALQARQGTLVLDLDWDPLLPGEDVVGALIGSLSALGLPSSQVRLVHANQSARAEFEENWRKLSADPPCRTLEFPTSFALGVMHQHGRRDDARNAARLEQARAALHGGAKARRFVSFNGQFRHTRFHILTWLHHIGALDEGFVSMLGYAKGPSGVSRRGVNGWRSAPQELRWMLAKLPYCAETAASVDPVFRMMPMVLDLRHDFRLAGYEQTVWSSQPAHYYDQSCFSLVMEPNCHRQGVLHLTEKVMKPILNAHPFLCLGSQSALKTLERYGFQSFAPHFREDYDREPQWRERMRLFLDELQRLCRMPEAELSDLARELWPRCEHNHQVFWGEALDRLAQEFRTEVVERLV